MPAIIDLTKGHHDHGKHTVHPNPARCTETKDIQNRMAVTSATAYNGIMLGQWNPCPCCTFTK